MKTVRDRIRPSLFILIALLLPSTSAIALQASDSSVGGMDTPSFDERQTREGPVDWEAVSFDSLENSVSGFGVRVVLEALSAQDSTFQRNLQERRSWECMAAILSTMRKAEEETPASMMDPDSPQARLIQLQMRHSGYYWGFWSRLAELRMLSEDLNLLETLPAAVQRVLAEMEKAFEPILYGPNPYFEN